MNSEKCDSSPLSGERAEISALLWDSNQGKLSSLFPWHSLAGNAELCFPRCKYIPPTLGTFVLATDRPSSPVKNYSSYVSQRGGTTITGPA